MPKGKSSQVIISKGTAITDDFNVGLKLLKKMGWTKDTGLGKDGNGILEPVKASSNFGRKGLGKGPTQANIDMVQQVHFESILQSLQSASVTASSSSDEEEDGVESNTRGSRLCYGRYLRVKDISNCDEHSLKVILGKSVVDPKEPSPEESCPPSSVATKKNEKTEEDHDFGVKTYSSSKDLKSYFAEKMKAKRSHQITDVSEPSLKKIRADDRLPKSSESPRPLFSLVDYQSDSNSFKATKSSKGRKKELKELPLPADSPVELTEASNDSDPRDTGSSKKSKSSESEKKDTKNAKFPKKSEEPAQPSSSKGENIVTNDDSSSSDSSSSSSSDELPKDKETAPSRPDSPDIFVNSNILSLKGYPYY